MVVLDFPSHGV